MTTKMLIDAVSITSSENKELMMERELRIPKQPIISKITKGKNKIKYPCIALKVFLNFNCIKYSCQV